MVEKTPPKDRAVASAGEAASGADSKDLVVHDMAVGTVAGKEEDTTAADSVGMEASWGPLAAHSTAGNHGSEPCEAVHKEHGAASGGEALASAARAAHRSDSS